MEAFSKYLKELDAIFDDAILNMIGIASGIGAFLIFINLGINYVNSFIQSQSGINGSPKFFDLPELKRSIVSYLMIFVIAPILISVRKIGRLINDMLGMDLSKSSNYFNALVSSTEDKLSFWDNFDLVFLVNISYNIGVFILLLIKTGIMIFSKAALAFVITVSPLAASFSILSIIKNQMTHLIKIGMNLAFVGVTLSIIDSMMFNVISKLITEKASEDMIFKIGMGATVFVVIVMYLLSIWLTSIYVGSPAAGALMSMATTVAAISAGAAIQAASLGASGIRSIANMGGSSGEPLSGVQETIKQAKGDIDKI